MPALPFEVQRFICEQLGQFKPPAEILALAKERFAVEVTHGQITGYKGSERWRPLIVRARAEYLNQVLDVPIANKMVRLERLEHLYQQAVQEPEDPQRREEARMHLVSAREEMREPEKAGTTNVYIHQQIATWDTETLEQRRREIVERLATLGDQNALSEARPTLREPESPEEITVSEPTSKAGGRGRHPGQ